MGRLQGHARDTTPRFRNRSASRSKAAGTGSNKESSAPPKSKGNVWLFVPNIIGYIRLIMTCSNLYLNIDVPDTFLAVYFASAGLDFFDGYFARLLEQCSEVGEMLDLICDM
jgi:CDP-diacylglycerol--inositol 3-phosphatidyltransferase